MAPQPIDARAAIAAAKLLAKEKEVLGKVAPIDTALVMARATLLQSLFKDFGEEGTLLDHPHGQSFTLRSDVAEGAVHSNKTIRVPLPNGGSVSHTADIVVELDGDHTLYVDMLDSASKLSDAKAGAFDALQLKTAARKPFAALVFVRGIHANLAQETVEAVAHSYDYVFGVNEADVSLGAKFAAFRSELNRRIKSAVGK